MIAGYVCGIVVARGLQILNSNKHLLEELGHAYKAHLTVAWQVRVCCLRCCTE